MAAVALIFGGTAGFISAVAALILFHASWIFALALWSLGGIAITAMLVAIVITQRAFVTQPEPEHA